MHSRHLEVKLRLGFKVFATLTALKIIEYVVGTSINRGAWPYLSMMAVVGAWAILHYFMHIPQLWRRKE